mmetsp:Transcript_89352/g.161238  ORF Transcript_89352/g.161238 Transcript_89352/m.161238 type:complete len:114 (+) Transcript_89352:1-342(+)
MMIIDNISFSKEKREGLDLQGLEKRGLLLLRDIVSDADKIDALGDEGLERCFEYTRYANPGACPPEIEQLVREHCIEKLLLLKDQYVRTATGKSLAQPGHNIIASFVNSNGGS